MTREEMYTLDLKNIRLTAAQFLVLFLMCAGTVAYAATTLATLKNVVASNEIVVARLNSLDNMSREHGARLERHEDEIQALQDRTRPVARERNTRRD